MALCFVDPADAIRAIADSIGREARRQLLGEAVRAWVDEIPDDELEVHYAKALSELDEHDLSMLAAWHGSLEVGQPVPNRDFLMGAFGSLGENRREALKLAAGFRGEEAVDAGVTEEDALELVLGLLSPPRLMELAVEAVELYIWDRAGSGQLATPSFLEACHVSRRALIEPMARRVSLRRSGLGLAVGLSVAGSRLLGGPRSWSWRTGLVGNAARPAR